jgi:hypothetical protein
VEEDVGCAGHDRCPGFVVVLKKDDATASSDFSGQTCLAFCNFLPSRVTEAKPFFVCSPEPPDEAEGLANRIGRTKNHMLSTCVFLIYQSGSTNASLYSDAGLRRAVVHLSF